MGAGNHGFRAGSSPPPPPEGADRDGYFEAARTGDLEYLRDFFSFYGDSHVNMRNDYDSTALEEAAVHGRDDAIALLLDHGADPETRDGASGVSPLMAAARQGKAACVKLLFARGADLEAKEKLGQTALVREASLGGERMVTLLLDLGADVEAGKDTGQTALRTAAIYGRTEIVRTLLSRGADAVIDLQDGQKNTPLMWAASGGTPQMVKALLDAGANMHLRNKDGETAVDIAKRKGHAGVARLIEDAKPDWRRRADEGAARRAKEKGASDLQRAEALTQLRKRAAENPFRLGKKPPGR